MAKKQKLLKNLLTSVSVASIVASIGGSSGAFAAVPIDNGGGAVALSGLAPAFPVDRDLTFNVLNDAGRAVTLTVDINENIGNITAAVLGNISIERSIEITKVTDGGSRMTASINDGITLTLTGAEHDGLGAVTLAGAGSTLRLLDGAELPSAAVITAGADGAGILTFVKAGTVTGSIGTDAKALAEINIGDATVAAAAGAAEVTLQEDVYTKKLSFAVADCDVKIAGNFGGGGGAVGAVDFGGRVGTLTFNGALGDLKEFNATIANSANSTLNVLGKLKAIHKDIGNIHIINIGEAANEGSLTIDASRDDVALRGVGGGAAQEINFAHADSVLGLYTNAVHTITFHDDLPGTAANKGTVLLEGAGNTLTVQSAGGKSLGTVGARLTQLEVRGKVTIAGDAGNKLNISNTPLLNIMKGAVFTDESTTSTQIANVHIGADGDGTGVGEANYVLDAKHGNFDILNGKIIHFKHATAQLTLKNSAAINKTITFHGNLEGIAGDGGIVSLEGTGGLLTLDSDDVAVRTFGANEALTKLDVRGQVNIAYRAVNKLDIHDVPILNVIKGAVFTDQGATSATIPEINIGVGDPAGITANDKLPGTATYVLDAVHGDFRILTDPAHKINFSHADAELILRNSDNTIALKTITLVNTLDPGRNATNPADGNGIVELKSDHNGKMLTIAEATKSLGTDHNELKELRFSGNGNFTIEPTIYAHDIILNIGVPASTVTTNNIKGRVTFAKPAILTVNNGITGGVTFTAAAVGARLEGNVTGAVVFNAAGRLKGDVGGGVTFAANGTTTGNVAGGVTVNNGAVGAVGGLIGRGVAFTGNGQLNAGGNITGDIDFAGHTGTVTMTAGVGAKKIDGNIKNGKDATLEFAGAGEVNKTIDKLKLLKAGNGNVKLCTGNHTINEIQGNGVGTLTFDDKFNLKEGAINKNGGAAVGLVFEGSSTIDGVVGSDKHPVGDIQIKAGTVAFNDSINAKDISILKAGIAEISKKFTAKSIKGDGTVRFNNKEELILAIPIETDTIEIAGGNIQAKEISAVNVLFSNSKEAILTLKEESIISNIETTGNNIHSLALNANLTIASGDNVGSKDNRLKEIKLLGNHTISIIGNNLYSNISTANKDSGTVLFNSDESVVHGNLGTNEFRLADVTFDSDSTVEGNIYSKKITIKNDKKAIFAGTEERTLKVPGVPRLLKDFTYSTEIVSEEINAENSSKIQFGNALVKAPINGGQITLLDNVWFKEKVTSAAPVTFAADKYVILEKDVQFASIEANRAKIIMLGEKQQTITGDLTAKDLTIDIGTSQVKYGNTAKLTGELNLRSFYDSSKLSGGNIEILSNGKLDISQLDKLVVSIVGQTDISEMPDEIEYTLISSVDGNGISILDTSKISLDSVNEQNRSVRWTLDPRNLTLHAKNISKEVLEKEKEELKKSASNSSEKMSLLDMLGNVTDKNSDAYKYWNERELMDQNNALLVDEKLLPGNTNPISMELAFIVSEAISQVTSQITSRSVNMLPVASGDDDKVTYGVWGSPFYAVGHQDKRKGISGYRSKSVGGIFGFDGLINDNLLVGVAYSKIDTKMSHKDRKIGDKTNGTTNLFSLYGSYKFPSNFFAEVVASYGITDVKNMEGRIVLDDNKKVTTGTAVAKYKSTSYSGQLLTGYNYQPSEKLTITPTIGLRYSQFMDDGHVQSGTACQNLTVKKTSYNKFEGILGLRTATNIQLDQLLLIPELHGYVNYDFKGKSPKIDARLGGIDGPLPTKSVKPAKVSFTVGTGLTVKSNMMEYGVTYNAHIADKYIGHQGSLKVKVNF